MTLPKYNCNRDSCKTCVTQSAPSFSSRTLTRGEHDPVEKCTLNSMLFVLSGELLYNSDEYPGLTLKTGDFILQAIGSKVERLALTRVEYLIFSFNSFPQLCEESYQDILNQSEAPVVYTPLRMNDRMQRFIDEMYSFLEYSRMLCPKYLDLKGQELSFLLFDSYEKPDLQRIFYPISVYTESFHYFVMKNYMKVKSVEEFARLGGYNVNTFRRLFRNVYGQAVYEWILNKKREGILQDLQYSGERINVISSRYGFESMSHFAHFCKDSFGYTPRALRNSLQVTKSPLSTEE